MGSEYKLCCVPKTCNYNPISDSFEVHEKGNRPTRAGNGRLLQPLKSIKVDEVPAFTCLCCKNVTEGIQWDSKIKQLCMIGYAQSWNERIGKQVLNSVPGVGAVGKCVACQACADYCSHFPTYTVGKTSATEQSLVHTQVISPRAGNKRG